MGVADGRFAAAIAARKAAARGDRVIVPSGVEATADFLAPLPVQLLASVAGLDDDFVELLQRLGVRQLGQLAALSVGDVLARFGRQGEFAHRIASGGDDRPPDTVEPPSGLVAMQVLDDPAHHVDTLVFIARQLADELSSALSADGKVCTRLIITAETDHSERNERLWYRSTGLSAAAMVERARWQLDAWVNSAGVTAGVTMLRLEPIEVRSDDGVQLACGAGAPRPTIGRRGPLPAWPHWRAPSMCWCPPPRVAGCPAMLTPGYRPSPLISPSPPSALPRPRARGRAACRARHQRWCMPSRWRSMCATSDGRPVKVTGRGAVSAAPATVQRGTTVAIGARSLRGPARGRWRNVGGMPPGPGDRHGSNC